MRVARRLLLDLGWWLLVVLTKRAPRDLAADLVVDECLAMLRHGREIDRRSAARARPYIRNTNRDQRDRPTSDL